jgi:hypothetical protein
VAGGRVGLMHAWRFLDWLAAAGWGSFCATLADRKVCCGWAHVGIVWWWWCWVGGGGVGMRGKARQGERCSLLDGQVEVRLDGCGKMGGCGDGEFCLVMAA